MMTMNFELHAQGIGLPKISQKIAETLAELVPLHEQQIGGELVLSVNGRDLHVFLAVGRDYSTWMKDRIAEYGFIEGVDFVTVEILRSPSSGNAKARRQRVKDYFLSIDMAKELSMLERNEQGKQARRYFIDCERRLALASPEQLAIAQAHWLENRGACKDNQRLMCQSLQQTRAAIGKDTKAYHYRNEVSMLNRLLLGMDSKAWLAAHGFAGEVRQHLSTQQLGLLSYLERSNAALIDAGFSFAERKALLALMLDAQIRQKGGAA